MALIDQLIIPRAIWVPLRDHIYNTRQREQAAGIIVGHDATVLRAIELWPLGEEHVIDATAGLRWDARFNLKLMKAARALRGGVMLAHAHPKQLYPCPSKTDRKTANVLFDFFGRELTGQINVMAVFGLNRAVYALADDRGRRYLLKEVITGDSADDRL
jgi:hypothetical protein